MEVEVGWGRFELNVTWLFFLRFPLSSLSSCDIHPIYASPSDDSALLAIHIHNLYQFALQLCLTTSIETRHIYLLFICFCKYQHTVSCSSVLDKEYIMHSHIAANSSFLVSSFVHSSSLHFGIASKCRIYTLTLSNTYRSLSSASDFMLYICFLLVSILQCCIRIYAGWRGCCMQVLRLSGVSVTGHWVL